MIRALAKKTEWKALGDGQATEVHLSSIHPISLPTLRRSRRFGLGYCLHNLTRKPWPIPWLCKSQPGIRRLLNNATLAALADVKLAAKLTMGSGIPGLGEDVSMLALQQPPPPSR